METILPCPIIKEGTTIIGFGGNQEWFVDEWAKKAGCASVSANDIYTYYTKQEHVFQKTEYIESMHTMFQIMKPRKMGFPYAYLYARRLYQCLLKEDIVVSYKVIRNPNVDDAINKVKKAIASKNPLGLLILKHRQKQLEDDIWHWVSIFGYREIPEGTMIVLSDCGEKKEVLARILFENHLCNYLKLVLFDKQ